MAGNVPVVTGQAVQVLADATQLAFDQANRAKAASDALPSQIAAGLAPVAAATTAAQKAASDAFQLSNLAGTVSTEGELAGKVAGQYRVGNQYVTWNGNAVTARSDMLASSTIVADLAQRSVTAYPTLTALLAKPLTSGETTRTTPDGNQYFPTATASGRLIYHGGDGTNWRRGVQNGRVTPDMFGLHGDGAFDNTSRWAEMVESFEGREVIVDIGAGAFFFDSGGHVLDYGVNGNGITLIGAGNGVTQLIVADDVAVLDYAASSINISGLRVQYATRRHGAALILRKFGSAQVDRVAGFGEIDSVLDIVGGNNGRYNDLRGIGGGRGQGGYMARFMASVDSSCTNHRVAGIFGREWAGGVLAQNDVAPGQGGRPSGLVGVEGIEVDGGSLEGVLVGAKATNGKAGYAPVLFRMMNLHINSRANLLDTQGWNQITASGNTGYLATGDAYPLQAYLARDGADVTILGNNTHSISDGTGPALDYEGIVLNNIDRPNVGTNIWDRPPAGSNPIVQLKGTSSLAVVDEQITNAGGPQVSDTSSGIHRRLPGGIVAQGKTSADVRVNAAFITVPFGTVLSATKLGLAATGVYTAPQAGTYRVSVSLQWYNTSNGNLPTAGESYQAMVRLNSGPTAFKISELTAAATGVITMSRSELVTLAVGDTLDVQAYSSADRYLSSGLCSFTVERL